MNTFPLIILDRSRARATKVAASLDEPMRDIEWEWCKTLDKAQERIAKEPQPLVIADWNTVGGAPGVRALCQSGATAPIVTTGRISQEDVVACIRAGAVNCIRRSDNARVREAIREALDDERDQPQTTGISPDEPTSNWQAQIADAEKAHAEYVGHLSHELRTPLNVIMGYSDMLLENAFGKLNQEQSKAIDRINRQSRELLELVDKTLELSRLDRGNTPLVVEEVDLAALLRDIGTEAVANGAKKGLDIHTNIAADLATVHIDRSKLRMVVECLVNNAIEFTDQGFVRIAADDHKDGVLITIADSGSGIPPEDMSKLFDAFFQGDNAKGGRGNGLGLHLVRRLIDTLDGTVEVESKLAEGSTFRIRIPSQKREG